MQQNIHASNDPGIVTGSSFSENNTRQFSYCTNHRPLALRPLLVRRLFSYFTALRYTTFLILVKNFTDRGKEISRTCSGASQSASSFFDDTSLSLHLANKSFSFQRVVVRWLGVGSAVTHLAAFAFEFIFGIFRALEWHATTLGSAGNVVSK